MSSFIDFLHEVFQGLGPITTRKMFGGYGVYHNSLMFGLVVDDTLYLKADESTIPEFESLKLEPFKYSKNGRDISMSYYCAPETIYDDPDEATRWGRAAYQVAVAAQTIKKSKKKPKDTTT